MTFDLTRDGTCVCGISVSLHFDRNRKLGCEIAAARFHQHDLESDRDAQLVGDARGPSPSHQFFDRPVHLFWS